MFQASFLRGRALNLISGGGGGISSLLLEPHGVTLENRHGAEGLVTHGTLVSELEIETSNSGAWAKTDPDGRCIFSLGI